MSSQTDGRPKRFIHLFAENGPVIRKTADRPPASQIRIEAAKRVPQDGAIWLIQASLNGQDTMRIDSPAKREFTFTPSFSLFVTCETEDQIPSRREARSKEGKPLMPLDNHGFSRKSGWTDDRYGVSRPLNLP